MHDYQLGRSVRLDDQEGRGREYSVPKLLKAEEDVPQGSVMREELDLAGAVEQDVVICPVSAFAPSYVWQASKCGPWKAAKPFSSQSRLCSSSSSA